MGRERALRRRWKTPAQHRLTRLPAGQVAGEYRGQHLPWRTPHDGAGEDHTGRRSTRRRRWRPAPRAVPPAPRQRRRSPSPRRPGRRTSAVARRWNSPGRQRRLAADTAARTGRRPCRRPRPPLPGRPSSGQTRSESDKSTPASSGPPPARLRALPFNTLQASSTPDCRRRAPEGCPSREDALHRTAVGGTDAMPTGPVREPRR